MNSEKNLIWFKETVAPKLRNYEIEYKFFEKGDFGSLNQIEFNSELKGGNIDFWSSGRVGVYLVDYVAGNEIINILMEPKEKEKINDNLEKLISLL